MQQHSAKDRWGSNGIKMADGCLVPSAKEITMKDQIFPLTSDF